MDKYEFNVKVEQLKKLADKGDYETAMKIADAIDWRRVHNVSLLSLVSDIYEKNEDYSEAKEILLLAYERAPIGKRLLYKLTGLAVKEGSIEEAESYCREFYDIAPDDARGYILKYIILKAKNSSLEKQIYALESYNNKELDEHWIYELAELYHEAGRSADCIRLCDNIMLMFGLGKYVDKAIKLKTEKEGQPLTPYQQGLIDNREQYKERLREVAEEYGNSYEADESYSDESHTEGGDQDESLTAESRLEDRPEPEAYPETYNEESQPEREYQEENGSQEIYSQESHAEESYMAESHGEEPYPEESYENQRNTEESFPNEGNTEDPYPEESYPETKSREESYTGAAHPDAAYVKEADKSEEVQESDTKEEVPDALVLAGIDEEIAAHIRELEEQEKLKARIEGFNGFEDFDMDEYEAEKTKVMPGIGKGISIEEADEEEAGYVESEEALPGMEPEDIIEEEASDKAASGTEIAEGNTDETASASEALPEGINKPEKAENEPSESMPSRKPESVAAKISLYMVEGKIAEEGINAAIALLKKINAVRGSKKQVAKIKAGRLNEIGVLASAEKIAGRDLIIEEAGDLNPDSVAELIRMMNEGFAGAVILADNPLQIDGLKNRYRELEELLVSEEGKEEETAIPQKDLSYEETADNESAHKEQEIEKHTEEKEEKESLNTDNLNTGTPGTLKAGNSNAETAGSVIAETAEETRPVNDRDEEYSDVKNNTADELPSEEVIISNTEDADIIVTGEDHRYRNMFADLPEEEAYVNEELDIDAFAKYASEYARDIDCSITGKSMLALYERIEVMEEDNIPLTRKNAEALIEEAADRAEKPSIGRRIAGIFSPKYDKSGMLILKEEHFIR